MFRLLIAALVLLSACDSAPLSESSTSQTDVEEEATLPPTSALEADSSYFAFRLTDLNGVMHIYVAPFNNPRKAFSIGETHSATLSANFTNDRRQLIVNRRGAGKANIYRVSNGQFTAEHEIPSVKFTSKWPLLVAAQGATPVLVVSEPGDTTEKFSVRDYSTFSVTSGPKEGQAFAVVGSDSIFVAQRENGINRVLLMDLNGSMIQDLSGGEFWQSSAASSSWNYNWKVDFDQHSRRFLVTINRAPSEAEQGVYIVSLDGDVEAQYTNEGYQRQFASWGPPGWMVYIRQADRDTIWAMEIATGEEHLLLSTDDFASAQEFALVDF